MSRFIALFAALSIAGCSTQGTGVAEVSEAAVGAESGGRTVTFQWASEGSSVTKGTMSADVPGYDAFLGHFLQVHSQTRMTSLDRSRGDYGSSPSDRWQPEGGPSRGEYHSGHVVAQLHNHNGQTMTCDFQLLSPDQGLNGGGSGQCRMSDGTKITDAVLRGD